MKYDAIVPTFLPNALSPCSRFKLTSSKQEAGKLVICLIFLSDPEAGGSTFLRKDGKSYQTSRCNIREDNILHSHIRSSVHSYVY
jgi:hypothetical protein